RKWITGLLQFLGERERHRRIFVEDDPAARVILDEGGSELADGCCRQPFHLRGLQHRSNKRELALVGVAHCFDHPEILSRESPTAGSRCETVSLSSGTSGALCQVMPRTFA